MVSATSTTTMVDIPTPTYTQGKHYTELANPLKQAPPVIVFFSFLDPKSYEWARKYEVVQTIRKQVPSGTIIDRYHASTGELQDLAHDLTAAWAVAKEMQLDDRVIDPLFQAVQGPTKVIDMQGVKAVFDSIGVPPLRFDREYAKLSVQKEAKWMREVERNFSIAKLPAVIVGGKYLIKTEALGVETDSNKVADVVKELLDLSH